MQNHYSDYEHEQERQEKMPHNREQLRSDEHYNRIAPRRVIVMREREEPRRKPWFNQGWAWMIIALIGIGTLLYVLSGLTDHVADMNQSIQEQTSVLRQQNNILQGIRESIDSVVLSIKDAVTDMINFFANYMK